MTVVRAAPHSKVLATAAAVVTHGGHGTVVRALAAGVPMVILPHGRDQADNTVRVTARGAGIKLSRGAKPRRIAAAVQRVLADPDMRLNAEHLGETVRRDAAAGRLVAELETAPTTTPVRGTVQPDGLSRRVFRGRPQLSREPPTATGRTARCR